MTAQVAVEFDLLQLLGHDEADVLGVEGVPAEGHFPEMVLVYKQSGFGKALAFAYDVRCSADGFQTDYIIKSVAPFNLRTRN